MSILTKISTRRLNKFTSLLPLAAALSPAMAQAAVLEEVMVTSQKREQNLQDVGISVSAFSNAMLRDLGMQNTTDLEAQTPNLMIGEYGGAGATTTVNIRGVAQLDFADYQESPNAVYVDGAYVSFIGGVNMSMYDLQRVEVLRGPQGTLFGRNATGGLLHLISNRPTDEFEAYVDLTVGDYDRIATEGAISGPLSDSVRGRVSFATNQHDGWMENQAGDDIVEDDTFNLRAQLEFDLGDATTLLLSGRYSDTDDVNAGVYHQVGSAPNPANDFLSEKINNSNRYLLDGFCTQFNGVPTMTPPGGSDCYGNVEQRDVYDVSPDVVGFFDREFYGASATLTWNVSDSVVLISLTDYQSIEKDYLEDNDSTLLPITVFSQTQDADQFSQELRLNGTSDDIEWILGAYYLKIDSESRQRVDQSAFFDIDFYNDVDHETESWAIFGQAEFLLTEKLSLITGLRWTYDEKDIDSLNQCLDTDAFGFGGTCAAFGIAFDTYIEGGRDDDDWAGKIQLDYQASDDWLWYAGVTRGNKGGALNATVGAGAGVTLADMQIEPEVLTNYEAGFKSTFMDGLGRLNASVFYYDYEDYQAYKFVGVAVSLFNTDATLFGGEVELQLTPVEGLDIMLGLGYLDSEVEDVVLPSGRVDEQDMPYAPELSFNGMVRYQWDAFGGSLAVQGDWSYVDDRYYSSVNHPIQQGDSYTVGNVRLSYESGNGNWYTALFVENVTDEERTVYSADLAFAGGGYGIESYAPPRWWGVTAGYRWD